MLVSGVVWGDLENGTFYLYYVIVRNSFHYEVNNKNRHSIDCFTKKIVNMESITIFASLIKYHEADKTITTRQNHYQNRTK